MTDCPECGSVVTHSVGGKHARCLDSECGWVGPLGETVPETTSPLDVDTRQGEVVFEIETPARRGRSGRTTVRLSPHEARSFAMELEVAANDADRRSDRDGDDGGGFGFDAPQPSAGGESRE